MVPRRIADPAHEEALPLLHATNAAATAHPEESAGFLSKITFTWLGALLKQGARAPLQPQDLWGIRESDEASHVAEKLRGALTENDVDSYALWRAIRQAFGFNMYLAGLCKFLGDCLGFVGPICINGVAFDLYLHPLIKYVEDPSTAWFYPRYYGFILSAVLFLSTVLQALCLHQHHHLVIREAIRVRSALTMAVYKKALTLSSQTKSTIGSGHILNLATTDATRILDLFYFVHYTWAAPLQLVLGMFLLVRFLGVAAFAGVAILIVLLPLSALLSSQAARISKKLIECTDTRLKFLNEVLRHIRIIKFYAWEVEMLDQVEQIRENELGFLKRMVVWNALSQVALQAGPILVSLSSFAVYAWIQSQPLTADAAFTSITLFSIFRLPLMMMPRIFSMIFQAHVSVERLAAFLALQEHSPQTLLPRAAPLGDAASKDTAKFEIQRASFGWNDRIVAEKTAANPESLASTVTLGDVSISIPKGKLTLVVGPVGSGKSTLLAALLNELKPVTGHVSMPIDKVSYTAQSPYLVNASIEDNIVFGGRRDTRRMRRVVDACELQSDLDMLPNGLQTELGENGINLSGGQKQRVSIARAAYPADQQIYIFDDALSALDANVSTKIFQKCFSEARDSLLAGQTRVLATHSLQFAQLAHQIIVMDKMRVVQTGPFDELMRNPSESPFAKMLETFAGKQTTTDTQEDNGDQAKPHTRRDSGEKKPASATAVEAKLVDATRLIEDEERAVGSVSSSVYTSYFRSCGLFMCIGALAVLVAAQLSQVSTDLWLTHWTSAPAGTAAQLTFYVSVYGYLSLTTIVLGFGGDLTSRLAGLSASRAIHHRLLRHIIKGTMRFFDTTPIGRVLNRFSNDMNTIDQKLNANVVSFTTMLLSLTSMLLIQSSSVPLLLVVLLPVFGLYYAVQLYYRKSCRELQRLDSTTKSPVFAHFTETLHGLVTIRAFQMVPTTLRNQAHRINENTKAFLSLNLINRWLGVRLESLGALITLCVACFVSQQHLVLSSAMAGLMLSYSQNVSGLLNWIVRSNIDMENALNSIERTDEYCRVDTEELELLDSPFTEGIATKSFALRHRPQWPEHGEIVFTNVQVKYHPRADLVLRDVTFTIRGGERVGICGRTGAGKSSLLLTLFRLVKTHAGRITIDNVDISQLALSDLRSRMAIIPQEPVLFAASIRFNLDPTRQLDDATLWSAIRKSHLHAFISRLPRQLDEQVMEAGENFSLGERQLICLARAILRNSKILCLDEATASMDHNTDTLIQSSIRREFADATVLTIAHRVQTILDYDKIMVLKQGRVAEFGTPNELLALANGELASMVAAH